MKPGGELNTGWVGGAGGPDTTPSTVDWTAPGGSRVRASHVGSLTAGGFTDVR